MIVLKRALTIVLIIAIQGGYVCAQPALKKAEKDSLLSVWNNPQQADTNRLKAMQRVAWHGYLFSQPDSAFYFAQLQYDLAEKKGLTMQMGTALNTQATALNFQGEYARAIDYYLRSLRIKEELGDRQGIGASLNNVGNIYKNQGDYATAMDYLFRSLVIREEIRDVKGIASSLGNIANVYLNQADLAKAMEYFSRCLAMMEELGDKQGIAGTLNNMGLIYSDLGEHQKAIDHHTRSLSIREEMGDRRGVSASLANIGNIYRANGDHARAIEFHTQSLRIREESGDRKGISGSLYNLGKTHSDRGEHVQAIAYGRRALSVAQELGDVAEIRDATSLLYGAYKVTGKHSEALQMHELYISMRDSIMSEENQRAVLRQEYQYDFEKKEALLAAEQEKKDAIAREELTRERAQRNLMGLGFLFVLLAGGGTGIFIHQRRRAEYRYRSARSEMKALQAQMRPHFIFNALNSINNHIEANDPQTASEYLIRFAKLMRTTLNSTLTEQVTLQDEMRTWENYLELERPNFRHGLSFKVMADADIDTQHTLIPPLLVQPLLENALWHGISPKLAAGHVEVKVSVADRLLTISVTDDGVGRHSATHDTDRHPGEDSVGISLTKERIALLDGGRAKGTGLFITDLPVGLRAELRLPLRTGL